MKFEEIINNEISVVVGIVTAILGISYPLLLQVIERIDTKYNSRAIISLLCRSYQYRLFVSLLCLDIMILFISVILQEFDELKLIVNVFRYFSMGGSLLLVVFFFSLCKKIMMFYRSDKLAAYFEKRDHYKFSIIRLLNNKHYRPCRLARNWLARNLLLDIPKTELAAWTDFMKYLILTDSGDLIVNSYQYLYSRIRLYRSCYEKKEPIVYNEYINKAVVAINSAICKSSERQFSFTNSVAMLSGYSGQYDGKINGVELRNTCWRCLIEMIYTDRMDLLYDYWEYADQRLSLFLKRKQGSESDERYIAKYKEFFIFLCAHLLYSKKHEALSRLLFYSHNIPPMYDMLPNNFVEVFRWYTKLYQDSFRTGFIYESQYTFYDDRDPLSSGTTRNAALDYLTVLTVRLQYIPPIYFNDIVLVYNDEYEKTPIGVKSYIDACNDLIKRAEALDQNALDKIFSKAQYKSNTVVVDFLKGYLQHLNSQAQIIEKTQEISPDIIKKDKTIVAAHLERYISEFSVFLTSNTIMPEFDTENVTDAFHKSIQMNSCTSKQIYPSNYFKEGQIVGIANFAEAISDEINYNFVRGIDTWFMAIGGSPINISSHNMYEAIYKLCPDVDNDVLLYFGYKESFVHLMGNHYKEDGGVSTVDDRVIYFLPDIIPFNNRLIVVDKRKMPKLALREPKEDTRRLFQYERISANYPIYWGLVDLKNDSVLRKELLNKNYDINDLKSQSYLSIYLYADFYIPSDSIRCHIAMIDSYSSEKDELDKIRKIKLNN